MDVTLINLSQSDTKNHTLFVNCCLNNKYILKLFSHHPTMQKHQRPGYEGREHLSDIIEEHSQVHNMSSLKENSQAIKDIKVHAQRCYLCGQAAEHNENTTESQKFQNIIIYPCFCNRTAHRACMKKHIIHNKLLSCDMCKANYAVGKLSRSFISGITREILFRCIENFFLWFVFSMLIGLVIYVITTFNATTDLIAVWKSVLIVLFGLIIFLMTLYVLCLLGKGLMRLGKIEIELYCNQTEIAYHSKNSKKILKDFLDHLTKSHVREEIITSMQTVMERDKLKHGSRQPTNMSLLREKLEENCEDSFEEINLDRLKTPKKILDVESEAETKPDSNRERVKTQGRFSEAVERIERYQKREMETKHKLHQLQLQREFENKNLSQIIEEMSSIHPKKSISSKQEIQQNRNENTLRLTIEDIVKNNLEELGQDNAYGIMGYKESKRESKKKSRGIRSEKTEKENTGNRSFDIRRENKNIEVGFKEIIRHDKEGNLETGKEEQTIVLDFSAEMKKKELKTHQQGQKSQKDQTLSITF